MQSVEIRDAIDTQDHGLALEYEPFLPDLACCLDDPRITVSPVVTAACDQPPAIPVALQPQPVAVVLHLKEPVWTVRDDGCFGRKAKLKHASNMEVRGSFCECR